MQQSRPDAANSAPRSIAWAPLQSIRRRRYRRAAEPLVAVSYGKVAKPLAAIPARTSAVRSTLCGRTEDRRWYRRSSCLHFPCSISPSIACCTRCSIPRPWRSNEDHGWRLRFCWPCIDRGTCASAPFPRIHWNISVRWPAGTSRWGSKPRVCCPSILLPPVKHLDHNSPCETPARSIHRVFRHSVRPCTWRCTPAWSAQLRIVFRSTWQSVQRRHKPSTTSTYSVLRCKYAERRSSVPLSDGSAYWGLHRDRPRSVRALGRRDRSLLAVPGRHVRYSSRHLPDAKLRVRHGPARRKG